MIFISAQPCDFYFLWQVEVQIVNFRKFGVSDKMNVLVWFPEIRRKELIQWEDLQKKYPEVKFFFYQDKGVNLGLYVSQLRPHILKQHFERYPELSKEVFFYHDSDIIFNKLPDFDKLASDNICWQSDTSHYLDYSYIIKKEKEGNIPDNEALNTFAEIGGILPDVIKSYDKKTGGAQSILKNIDASFWEDVENMSLEIRKRFFWGAKDNPNVGSINTKYFLSENAGFQSWCADMWALNFSLWKRGLVTDVTDELDFSWATDSIEIYNKKPIFHNAGVTANHSGLFCKSQWMLKSPISINHVVIPDTASAMYVKAINDVK